MVFIHGGAYNGGNPSTPMYRGTSLVERGDIVYVSIQYRLGALGYLDFSEYSTAERSFETNLGLRDQIAALTWVQRNIAAFGGDPNAVTVFGESSGANAVTTLMATPAARGCSPRPSLKVRRLLRHTEKSERTVGHASSSRSHRLRTPIRHRGCAPLR